jgi:hypothetical protein
MIIQFPAIRVERELNGLAWLIRTHNREHGWLCGDFHTALRDAREVAAGYRVAIVSSAGVLSCS